MWNERYSSEEYAYGRQPNTFLVDHVGAIPNGDVLCIGEGEGRNAVFLAKHGYNVTAVDASSIGLAKAKKLAEEEGVQIEIICADLETFDFSENRWDGVVEIFCPLPTELRKRIYKKIVSGLKPQGVFLVEAYTPDQLALGTGGGKTANTMFFKEFLEVELNALKFLHLAELKRNVLEGSYHTGIGAVVQAVAMKDPS